MRAARGWLSKAVPGKQAMGTWKETTTHGHRSASDYCLPMPSLATPCPQGRHLLHARLHTHPIASPPTLVVAALLIIILVFIILQLHVSGSIQLHTQAHAIRVKIILRDGPTGRERQCVGQGWQGKDQPRREEHIDEGADRPGGKRQ